AEGATRKHNSTWRRRRNTSNSVQHLLAVIDEPRAARALVDLFALDDLDVELARESHAAAAASSVDSLDDGRMELGAQAAVATHDLLVDLARDFLAPHRHALAFGAQLGETRFCPLLGLG